MRHWFFRLLPVAGLLCPPLMARGAPAPVVDYEPVASRATGTGTETGGTRPGTGTGPVGGASASPFGAPSGDGNLQVPVGAGRREESAPFELPLDDGNLPFAKPTQGLVAWFVALGAPQPHETFGGYVVRAAGLMLGRPYAYAVELPGQEVIDFNVDQFQCESFVESSLAVARCGWTTEPTVACFRREVARIRYRHGTMRGYSSRLHYFEDWLDDNARRGTVNIFTRELGSKKLQRPTAYMTDHVNLYPALQDSNELRAIGATERRLSRRPVDVVFRRQVAAAERQLQSGDIVAIVTRRPGILVHHAGLVERDADGNIHLLHASSAQHRVVRTREGIAAYIIRRPERQGIMVARPIAPAAANRPLHYERASPRNLRPNGARPSPMEANTR